MLRTGCSLPNGKLVRPCKQPYSSDLCKADNLESPCRQENLPCRSVKCKCLPKNNTIDRQKREKQFAFWKDIDVQDPWLYSANEFKLIFRKSWRLRRRKEQMSAFFSALTHSMSGQGVSRAFFHSWETVHSEIVGISFLLISVVSWLHIWSCFCSCLRRSRDTSNSWPPNSDVWWLCTVELSLFHPGT